MRGHQDVCRRRAQQQRRRVDGAAGDDHERAPTRMVSPFRSTSTASTFLPDGSVTSRSASALVHISTLGLASAGSMPHTSASLLAWIRHGKELHVRQSTQPPGSPGRIKPSGRCDGCSPWRRSASTISAMPGSGESARRETARAAVRSDRRRAGRARDTALGLVVVRRRACRSRSATPARRRPCARTPEILAPQAIEHAAPELGVAADAVVRVGKKLDALRVEPALGRAIAQVLPDGLGIPVVRLLRHGLAALEHEDSRRRLSTTRVPWCRRRRRCR